jgi:hypothetical protein
MTSILLAGNYYSIRFAYFTIKQCLQVQPTEPSAHVKYTLCVDNRICKTENPNDRTLPAFLPPISWVTDMRVHVSTLNGTLNMELLGILDKSTDI